MRYIVFLTVLGLILGFTIGKANNAGYFERWQKVVAPPTELSELVVSGRGDVYARTSTSETYRCTTWLEECWMPDEVPPDTSWREWPNVVVTKPCDLSTPEFFFLAGPPKDTIDCIQNQTIYADGWMKYAYVLDRDSNVWEWSHGWGVRSSAGDTYCTPIFGLTLGLAIGIIWSKYKARGTRTRDPRK